MLTVRRSVGGHGARRGLAWLVLVGLAALLGLAAADRPWRYGQPRQAAGEVLVVVDAGRVLRPISPLIYGVAGAGPAELRATGARVNRWGGNPSSRYNWALGQAWNSARDWFFRNGNYGQTSDQARRPSGVADRFVEETLAAGASAFVTIPALGWVARDDDNRSASFGVPPTGGRALDAAGAIAGYDPAANRRATSLRSLARNPGSSERSDEPVYQDDWVRHLVARFGPAGEGGVRYYAVDNEPDLWSETHTDVHPAQLGYDDLVAVFLEYAEAIKAVDPTALVAGPTLSGWTAYWYSPLDRGADNFRTHAERRAHGDAPLLPWWLDQVRQHDEQVGHRTLDLLDVHFYPQGAGVYPGATDPATNALRLRSTRALWDPSYVDESWIRTPVRLIPRLREWVETSYPGTPLAIGEWSWGAERDLSGALAIADVLGIFGREGVDLACYWTVPPPDSPGARAFALFTNYDGQGHGFGDLALQASSSERYAVPVYASRDSRTGDLVVVIINKEAEGAVRATLRLEGDQATSARLYRLGAAAPDRIVELGELPIERGELTIDLPPLSATLLRLLH